MSKWFFVVYNYIKLDFWRKTMDLNKRPENMERITTLELANKFIDEQVKLIKEQVGNKKVLLARKISFITVPPLLLYILF